MFGKRLERYCNKCKETVDFVVSEGFRVEENIYYPFFPCKKCGKDLGKQDQEALRKAKEEKKNITLFKF